MIYFAYHRTSTMDQNLDRGIAEIQGFASQKGIELFNSIYTDQCTGKNFDRPAFKQLINDIDLLQKAMKASDVLKGEKIALIVTELDRLGRNKQLTLREIKKMQDKGIKLLVLEIPTTLVDYSAFKDNTMAKMMMETINNLLVEMYSSFAHAEMEKREKRQREGIEAKKARGEWADYGRPRTLEFDKFVKEYKRVLNGSIKPSECYRLLNIPKTTYYGYVKEYKDKFNT